MRVKLSCACRVQDEWVIGALGGNALRTYLDVGMYASMLGIFIRQECIRDQVESYQLM